MSEKGFGPKSIYQTNEYRIEEFINARPLTIWEMRNPVIMASFAKSLFNFNFNTLAVEKLRILVPVDINNLMIDVGINEWALLVKDRLPSMRGKLL